MLEYEFICEGRVGCLQWDRGVGGAEQEETGAGKIEGSERVPQACPGSDGSPDNLLCNGLPLSLSECCEIAGRRSTAEDSEETNGLLIQSAER